jgi:hypothetical protein
MHLFVLEMTNLDTELKEIYKGHTAEEWFIKLLYKQQKSTF